MIWIVFLRKNRLYSFICSLSEEQAGGARGQEKDGCAREHGAMEWKSRVQSK